MALAKVMLIEDDLLLRNAIGEILTHRTFEVVGLVDSAEEALLINEQKMPDVVIADLDLGLGPNGIDIVHALRKTNPNLGVVFLTSFSDPRLSDPTNLKLPQGALYFTKSRIQDINVLVTAVLRAKNQPLSPVRRMEPDYQPLSDMQIEILRRVSLGESSNFIAQEMGLSVKTIEANLSKIHQILGLERQQNVSPRIQLTRAFFALIGKKPPEHP